jgi:hypothetical protein
VNVCIGQGQPKSFRIESYPEEAYAIIIFLFFYFILLILFFIFLEKKRKVLATHLRQKAIEKVTGGRKSWRKRKSGPRILSEDQVSSESGPPPCG